MISGSAQHADPLPLATAVTERARSLCEGLETGDAEIFERVTPVTAELLRWWFGEDMVAARGALNFHRGQRQAILNAIVAHEVIGRPTLLSLYQEVAPHALLAGRRMEELAQPKHAHPKYCFKMATGTGKTWVLQALLAWQLLNKTEALAQESPGGYFTRHFLLVAPGLIVYERLLDALLGKAVAGGRDFAQSDIARYAELFIPPARREQVFAFVQGNVCEKHEIGLKATGNGMIAVANWQQLALADDEEEELEIVAAGAPPSPERVVAAVLPLTPGRATGNSLEVLDRRYARGNIVEFLAGLPELMVFNDEAHHIHEVKREGETSEVEWQKSLSRIAQPKGPRFIQMDFSATPYNDLGSGKKARKVFFPHVVCDFDLIEAMKAGLVKSLVLDKRSEVGALPLDFKAQRDADGNVALSEGQRVMLAAGIAKLRKLETELAEIDPQRRPKMLVMCEDTAVTPQVERYLVDDQGLAGEDVLTIDSGRKAALSDKDWAAVRERLFDVDRHAAPRVIVSVLMLREGFDVNNICVIVPLRTSGAQILLEQTIGRGLRLMWRDAEYDELKRETRERIRGGREPDNLLDVLSIVEHPAFSRFYDELKVQGLLVESGEGPDVPAGGDLIPSLLRPGFEEFDFAIPFILRDADETRERHAIDVAALPAFTTMGLPQLKTLVGRGDQFVSEDLQSSVMFGGYRVDGAVMNVAGYNEYLARLARRIAQLLSEPPPRSGRAAAHTRKPYMQVDVAELAQALDDYIWLHLFRGDFNPHDDENWRLLLLQPVLDHLVQKFAMALLEADQGGRSTPAEVRHRRLSEVPRLTVRESASVEVSKCIYQRLPYPTRGGGLEKAFIEWAQADAGVHAFCKISENRHTFARLRYVREDGLPAFYSPDFLVRTAKGIYLVETKAQGQVAHPNVQRKMKAAISWCDRINELEPGQRQSLPWHYVLLGQDVVEHWRGKTGRLGDLLEFARLRPQANATHQGSLPLA